MGETQLATLGDYRRSRYLTQTELAALAQLGIATVKRWEAREIDSTAWQHVRAAEHSLNYLAEAPQIVSAKVLDPFTLDRMPARKMERLPVGHCFASFGYLQLDDPSFAALKMRRPDLAALARTCEGKRVITLYRVITSRYARTYLRKGFGVAVADIRPATLRPLTDFKPEGLDVEGSQNMHGLS